MTKFTIETLKKHLGPGLGLRKNKYLLEIPIPGIDGEKINVLARSAGLPERSIEVASVSHKGRKYNIRSETNYGGTYEVSIVDDSSMSIRSKFDDWMLLVDNSTPKSERFSGASYEKGIGSILELAKSGVLAAGSATKILANPMEEIGGLVVGDLDSSREGALANYQTDINIWQLSSNSDKVYGYKLQNAFPSQIGIVTLDDENPNTLSEFSINFSFSEFIPLIGATIPEQVFSALIGADANQLVNTLT